MLRYPDVITHLQRAFQKA